MAQTAPFLSVVIGAAVLAGACSDVILPAAVRGRQRIQRDDIRHVDPLTQFYTRRTPWFREGDMILYLPEVGADAHFVSPVVYRMREGKIDEVIRAAALVHDGHTWALREVHSWHLQPAAFVEQDRLSLALRVSPEDLRDVTGNPREMTWRAVAALIERRDHAGFDTTAHRLELHSRLAFPLSAVALVVLALPWALHPDRRRSLSMTLGAGVVVIALYLSVSQLFRLLGLAHKIPVPWGAWGGPAACVAAVPLSYLLFAVRRRH